MTSLHDLWERKRSLIIAIGLFIALLSTFFFLNYYRDVERNRYFGLFKGAYAEYYGKTSALFLTFEIKIRMELLDFNSTHQKWLFYTKIESPIGSHEDSYSRWISNDELALNDAYEDTIYLEGIGTRDVYVLKDGEQTYYYDKETGWMLKFTYQYENYFFEMVLVKSNVPALKDLLNEG